MLLNHANAIYQEWWTITYSCLEWYSQSRRSICDTTRMVIGGVWRLSASVCGIADCGATVLLRLLLWVVCASSHRGCLHGVRTRRCGFLSSGSGICWTRTTRVLDACFLCGSRQRELWHAGSLMACWCARKSRRLCSVGVVGFIGPPLSRRLIDTSVRAESAALAY